jgi:pSer/pThr/pTyr-binding forkhead associated (FHA) protein
VPKIIHNRDGQFQKEWVLKPGNLLIGRHPDCDIRLDDTTVSGRHAMITVRNSPYMEGLLDVFIEDLDSTNGTLVNGKKVRRHMLKHGETAHIGGHEFAFVDEATRGFETTTVILPDAD